MLAKKIRAKIDEDKTLTLHLPDMPQGEVEVIILKKEDGSVPIKEILLRMPKHRVGKVLSSLRREDIYTNAR
jgi:hypothetical protein